MKQYSLILLILLSLTANAVAGFIVPQLTEHTAEAMTMEMEGHSSDSHHNKSLEKNHTENHNCPESLTCHDSEDCCVQSCQTVTYAVFQELPPENRPIPHQFSAEYNSVSVSPSHSIPYFPD